MPKSYKVILYKRAAYYAEVYVNAESPEGAKLVALKKDASELNWDSSDPFCDTKVSRVVAYEEETAAHPDCRAEQQEELAEGNAEYPFPPDVKGFPDAHISYAGRPLGWGPYRLADTMQLCLPDSNLDTPIRIKHLTRF